MANLGTLTTAKGGRSAPAYIVPGWPSGLAPSFSVNAYRMPRRRIATWAISPVTRANGSDIDVSGSITGSVKQGAAAIPFCFVRCYYRPNGMLIDQLQCDAAGLFTFTGLEVGAGKYFVLAFDPDGSPVQNALVYDWVVPS